MMLCFFNYRKNDEFRFMIGQTNFSPESDKLKRLNYANIIKSYIGEICVTNPDLFLDMPIIIGGNFNDEPKCDSIKLMNSSF